MSLFGSIQQSSNALSVAQLGLHVAGNNIANANTPGYIRQELVQSTGPGYRIGDIILGYGVRAEGVVQKIDQFLSERLRQTGSSLASSEALGEIYDQIEASFAEMGDNDISTHISSFANSIQDLLNQPGNDSLRRLIIERGKSLTGRLNSLSNDMLSLSNQISERIQESGGEINRLTERLADLNKRIVQLEGGRSSGSDAVGLRDERIKVLSEMSSIVDIRAVEQPSGSVTVYVGGEYLVAEGIQRKVSFVLSDEGDQFRPEIRLADTDSPLNVGAGRLKGLYEARDGAVTRARADLDTFARNLIEQFNRIHTQGQGLEGFSTHTSEFGTDDPTAPLDLAGFGTEIENGSFEIRIRDTESGQEKTASIRIQLTGAADDTTLEDVRDQISAISGLTASITSEGRLKIDTTNNKLRFAFQNDNAGFLTAVGMNTFFKGNSAATIRIHESITSNPRLLAASLSGIDGGTENALKLAEAFDTALENLGGQSLKQNFEAMVVRTTQEINVQHGTIDGLRNFYKTLEGQNLASSGVNLDEEAVKMIFYQRAFQASSRVIKASSEMLDTLVNL